MIDLRQLFNNAINVNGLKSLIKRKMVSLSRREWEMCQLQTVYKKNTVYVKA